jgi:ankyrin repeat protein
MKNRLGQLKHSRSQLKPKYSSCRAQQPADAGAINNEPSDTFVEHIPAGVPSHIFLPRSNIPGYPITFGRSGQTCQAGSLDDSCFSNKEVVVTDTPETCSGPVLGSVQEIPQDSEVSHPDNNPQLTPSLTLESQSTAASLSRDLNEPQPQVNRLRSTSILRKASSSGFQTVRQSVSSKLSRSLSHVESVISATNSWRSSLIYAMSSSSRRSQNSTHVNLTCHEYMAWAELVDESKLDSPDQMPNRPSDYEAISLVSRPCCELLLAQDHSNCPTCFFSRIHERARTSSFTDGDLFNLCYSSSLDRFGNTPFHHAAAAGNYSGVLKLMSLSDAKTPARNTSGETYMHVLGISREMAFSEFLHILKTAAKQGFDFLSPDYSGNTAARRLHETVLGWKLELDPLDISKRLSEIFDVPVSTFIPAKQQSSDSSAGSLHPKSSQDKLDENGNTKLIAVLRDWKNNPIPIPLLLELIESSNVHMRDRRGYTALELAVGNGLEDAATLLLNRGANPNTRSYRGTSVLAHATVRLAQAQEEGKGALYAQILSCIALLADAGGKTPVNVFDEYAVPTPKRQEFKPSGNLDQSIVGSRQKNIVRHQNEKTSVVWHREKVRSDKAVKFSKSHEGFLNWVAYTRNMSPNIHQIERRTCPLIGCEKCFVDSDAMLMHLKTCPKFSRGLYRCFESGQSERIGQCETPGCSEFYQGKLAAVVNALERRLSPRRPKFLPLASAMSGKESLSAEMTETFDPSLRDKSYPVGVTEVDGSHGILPELSPESLIPEILPEIGQSSEDPCSNLEEGQNLGLEMDSSSSTGFWTTAAGVSMIAAVEPRSEDSYLHLEEDQNLGLEMDWISPISSSTTPTGVSESMFSAMDLLPLGSSTLEQITVRNSQTHENDQLHPTTVPSVSISEPQKPVAHHAHAPYDYSPILPSVTTSGSKPPATYMLNDNPFVLDYVEETSANWQDTTAQMVTMPATAAYMPGVSPPKRIPSDFFESFNEPPLNSSLIPLQPRDTETMPTSFARERMKPDIDCSVRQRNVHSITAKKTPQLRCIHCQRNFNDKSNLKRHEITCQRNMSFNSNRQYRCTHPHCQASYTHSDNLEAHQRKKHRQKDGS